MCRHGGGYRCGVFSPQEPICPPIFAPDRAAGAEWAGTASVMPAIRVGYVYPAGVYPVS